MKNKVRLILAAAVICAFGAIVAAVFSFLHEPGEETPHDFYVAAIAYELIQPIESAEPIEAAEYYDEPMVEYDEPEYPEDMDYDIAIEEDTFYEYPDYDEYERYEAQEPVVEHAVQTPPPGGWRPMVALTFDDGPAASTSRILNVLDSHDAKATFFVLGRRLDEWSSTVLRAFNNGHEIANHTFGHQILLPPLTDEEIINEILFASAAIEAVTGVPPAPMFRPPAGRRDDRLLQISYEIGYAVILWNLDPFDWRDRDPDIIYQHIMTNVRDGSIVVLHDTHDTTAQAMERVVPRLIEMGFELVTVSELLFRNLGRSPMPGQIYR